MRVNKPITIRIGDTIIAQGAWFSFSEGCITETMYKCHISIDSTVPFKLVAGTKTALWINDEQHFGKLTIANSNLASLVIELEEVMSC